LFQQLAPHLILLPSYACRHILLQLREGFDICGVISSDAKPNDLSKYKTAVYLGMPSEAGTLYPDGLLETLNL
jgi:hypothetical protein